MRSRHIYRWVLRFLAEGLEDLHEKSPGRSSFRSSFASNPINWMSANALKPRQSLLYEFGELSRPSPLYSIL